MPTRSKPLLSLVLLVVLAVVATACNWRGPAPTNATIEAVTGPFAIEQVTVGAHEGFAAATIYYPVGTTQRFGGVAIVPGYSASQPSISWYGPRLASQGFVVMTIDTPSVWDPPIARRASLLAALDYLTTESAVVDTVDPDRLAVMGWSMGGGGALLAARDRPSLKAAIPLAPWSPTKDFPTLAVPTMIVGCENDLTAPVDVHVDPLYPTFPASLSKAYLEIADANHSCVTVPNTTIARSVIAWLKRHVDNDTRYDQFLCPPPSGPAISRYWSTCDAA